MGSTTRLVATAVALLAAATTAGAQQSVRVPNDTVRPLTKAQLQEAREAYAMKCLSAEAMATRIASSGEIAPTPSKVPVARGNALGLGELDASQGLVRPQHRAQFDPKEVAASQGSNVRAAMAARNESYRGGGIPCQPPQVKTPRPQ